MLVVAGLLLIGQLFLVVLPVVVGLFLATLLEPLSRGLQRRGVPDGLAAIIVLAVSLVVFVSVIALLAPQVAQQLAGFGEEAEQGREDVQRWLEHGPLGVGPEQVATFLEVVRQQLATNAGHVATGVLTGRSWRSRSSSASS